MVAHAVLSFVGIATLGTDVPGNTVMHRNNMFQDRSFAAGHGSHSLQVKRHWTSDLRHGCRCCAKCSRYRHTWYRRTRKHGYAQKQVVPSKTFCRWTLVTQFTAKNTLH